MMLDTSMLTAPRRAAEDVVEMHFKRYKAKREEEEAAPIESDIPVSAGDMQIAITKTDRPLKRERVEKAYTSATKKGIAT
jgi:hypothetical protein